MLAVALTMCVLAAPGEPSAPVLVSAEGAPLLAPAPGHPPILGAAFDIGAPDGAALSAVLFPRSWIRIGGGVLTHLGGVGLRVSLAVSPLNGPVRPLIAADYGHYFPGDFSWVLGSSGSTLAKDALKHVQYDFLNAHLGLELGAGRFSFSIRGGISYVTGTLGAFSLDSDAGPLTGTGPRIALLIPSGKLGLTWYFF